MIPGQLFTWSLSPCESQELNSFHFPFSACHLDLKVFLEHTVPGAFLLPKGTWVQMPALPLPGPVASSKLLTSFTFIVLTHKMEIMTPLHSYIKYEGKVHGIEPLTKKGPVELLCKVKQKPGRGLKGDPKEQAAVPFLESGPVVWLGRLRLCPGS